MEIKYPVYQPLLNGNEKKYVNDCLDTNWISSRGSYIKQFEEKFAEFVEIEHATTVCNGTAAVELALLTLGIGKGDEVIVPTLVYVAVPNMVMFTGATPVFVDSLHGTLQMDPEDIRRKITPRTRAVIAVHNYGHSCEMDSIKSICESHKLFLVEDCAEALGGKYKGRHVGHWGDFSTYSFFGNKTITTGEGGMLTSHSGDLIQKAFHIKNQGVTTRVYWHDMLANNYRMTNITAAIGLAQLERSEVILKRKRYIAELYMHYFRGTEFEFHQGNDDIVHSYWMCSILTKLPSQRDPLREFLLSEGIETRPFFYPAHTMPMYANSSPGNFPIAEDISSRGINLPSFPALKDEDIRFIASKVLTFAGK
jgi:perosamine synthetase